MKKIIIAVCALVIVSGTVLGVYKTNAAKGSETSTVSKETVVSFGDVTSGVTESSTVNVESLSQTYDLTLKSTSINASVDSSSSSSNSSSNAMDMMGMGMMGGGQSFGSTSVTTSSSETSVELIVDQVFITQGQTVSAGNVIMSITEESISDARAELEKAVTDAELALSQAKIDESETLLSASYEYDKRIAEGKAASESYNAALDEISSNISTLNSQISETSSTIATLETSISECTDEQQLSQLETQLKQSQSELKSYQSQLDSATSSRSSSELSAKQEYEEKVMYYENAKSLYDISVSDVGDATEDAQADVDTANDNLAAFEEFINDGNLKAEYSGTITGVNYSSGDTLSSDTALAEYADAETITVTVNVTEDDISAVNLEDTVDISFLAYPDDMYQGYVYEIGSSASTTNSSTVSYPVTIVITSFPDTILTGMTANVTFITKQVKDVLYVSNKAVTTEGIKSYVLKMNSDGSSERVEVKTGFSNGTNVEISSGISEGDTVLIESKVSS